MTTTEPKPSRLKTWLTIAFVVAAIVFIAGFMWPMLREMLHGAGVLK